MRPRVLHFFLGVPMVDGGAERVLASLATLPSIDAGVGLTCRPDDGPDLASFRKRLPAGCPVWYELPDIVFPHQLIYSRRIGRALRDFAPDISHIHAAGPNCSSALPLALKMWKPSTAVLLHAHLVPTPADLERWIGGVRGRAVWGRYRAALRVSIPFVDAVVAVSETARQALIDGWGLPPAAVRVISNATDIPVDPLVTRERIDRARIVTVAALRPQKRIDLLLRAARALADSGCDFEWRIVGDGPQRREYERLACDLGLGDRVVFEGRSEAVVQSLRWADLFVLVSEREGLCLAVLESLAQGLPTLLTDGAASSIPRHAFHHVHSDPEQIAREVGALIADDGARRELGARGRAVVEQRFGMPRFTTEISACYEEIILRQRPRSPLVLHEEGEA